MQIFSFLPCIQCVTYWNVCHQLLQYSGICVSVCLWWTESGGGDDVTNQRCWIRSNNCRNDAENCRSRNSGQVVTFSAVTVLWNMDDVWLGFCCGWSDPLWSIVSKAVGFCRWYYSQIHSVWHTCYEALSDYYYVAVLINSSTTNATCFVLDWALGNRLMIDSSVMCRQSDSRSAIQMTLLLLLLRSG